MYYNYKAYAAYIRPKYISSQEHYTKQFKPDESTELFLTIYESMNVYPIYPRPIIMPLKKNNKFGINLKPNSSLKFNNVEMAKLSKILHDKLDEYQEQVKNIRKYRNMDKIRRFFDYELRDRIKEIRKTKITNAWVKMYEILATYKPFQNIDSHTINTFHICEHPGAFIFATTDWIKNRLNKKHNFIFQSLRPGKNPQIFRPDPSLLKSHRNKLDYGPNNGDITDDANLLHYRDKYIKQQNIHFHFITSDCGLSFSDDFKVQEDGLYKIFLGALIGAIALSSQGSNYVFKLFSFNTVKTIELLHLACLFYDSVDLVRLLSTKSGSGEIYCYCKNFNYKENIDDVLIILLDHLNNKDDNKFIFDIFDNTFIDLIINHHKLLTIRRVTNMNALLFRLLNFQYAHEHSEVRTYVQHFVDYYVKYFLSYLNIVESDISANKPLTIKNI